MNLLTPHYIAASVGTSYVDDVRNIKYPIIFTSYYDDEEGGNRWCFVATTIYGLKWFYQVRLVDTGKIKYRYIRFSNNDDDSHVVYNTGWKTIQTQ